MASGFWETTGGDGDRQVAVGYYVTPDDEVFTVVRSEDGKRRYAKRFTLETSPFTGQKRGRWVYERGALSRLAGLERLAEDEVARRTGRLYGVCLRCGQLLIDPVSVAMGLGPTCRRAA